MHTFVLQPPHESGAGQGQSMEDDEEKINCPICQKFFPLRLIEVCMLEGGRGYGGKGATDRHTVLNYHCYYCNLTHLLTCFLFIYLSFLVKTNQ